MPPATHFFNPAVQLTTTVIDAVPVCSIMAPTSEPRWREKPELKPVTHREYVACVNSVIQKAVIVADSDPVKLAQLVKAMGGFSADSRALVLEQLAQHAEKLERVPADFALWETLRHLVNHHRKFADTEWALPEEELAKIGPLVKQFRPTSTFRQFEWLFNDWSPDLPGASPETRNDYAATETLIETARRDALATLYAEDGIHGIYSIAKAVKYPGFVGYTLASLSTALTFAQEFLNATLGGCGADRNRRQHGADCDSPLSLGGEDSTPDGHGIRTECCRYCELSLVNLLR